MKKVSTVAAERSSNLSKRKLTIGLDLGDRSNWYCVLNGSRAVVLEQRVSTSPRALRKVFGGRAGTRFRC